MPWQFFILISVFFYSIATILQRLLLKESNSKPIAYSLVFQVLVSIMLGLAGFLQGRWQLPNIQPILINLIIMTFLYAGANIFLFKALKTVEASKFTILFSIRGFITVIASTIFLKENLSLLQLFGASLIFVAIILINVKSRKLTFVRGDLLALLTGVCFGLANTNDRILLSRMDVYVFTSIGFLIPAMLIALMYPKEVPYVRLFLKPELFKKMIVFSLVYAVSAITFFIALQRTDNSSQVATINLTSVIIIVLLSIIFLKEKTMMVKKVMAALLSFIGLWLITK